MIATQLGRELVPQLLVATAARFFNNPTADIGRLTANSNCITLGGKEVENCAGVSDSDKSRLPQALAP